VKANPETRPSRQRRARDLIFITVVTCFDQSGFAAVLGPGRAVDSIASTLLRIDCCFRDPTSTRRDDGGRRIQKREVMGL
jgi:hypothetical protein